MSGYRALNRKENYLPLSKSLPGLRSRTLVLIGPVTAGAAAFTAGGCREYAAPLGSLNLHRCLHQHISSVIARCLPWEFSPGLDLLENFGSAFTVGCCREYAPLREFQPPQVPAPRHFFQFIAKCLSWQISPGRSRREISNQHCYLPPYINVCSTKSR